MTTMNTFKRKEVKYMLTSEQYAAVKDALGAYMSPDKYGANVINSIYLDTPDRYLIERSLEKPLYKEKLRIRRYGDALEDNTQVFLEIKKKYKGIVYKRRIALNWAAAKAFLSGMSYEDALEAFPEDTPENQAHAQSATSRQIAREICAFCSQYENLRPSMEIRVVRTAWALDAQFAKETPFDLRVTFDEEMQSLDLFDPFATWQDVGPHAAVLMEIKATGAYPLWLVDILDAYGCKPMSFSKYGTAYTNAMQEHREQKQGKHEMSYCETRPESLQYTNQNKGGLQCSIA